MVAAVIVTAGFTSPFMGERLSDPPKATELEGGRTDPHGADFPLCNLPRRRAGLPT